MPIRIAGFMAHEDLFREEEIHGSSDRAFGLVFAAVFATIGLWPLASGGSVRLWSLTCAAAVLAVALAAPAVLAAPNRAWTRLGVLIGRFVNPVVIGLMFYFVITPFGVLGRVLRRDPLRLAYDREARTYWVERDPPGPDPSGMGNQF